MTDRRLQFNRDMVVAGAVAVGLHLAAYLVAISPRLAQARTIAAETPRQLARALTLTIQTAPPIETQPVEPLAPLPLPARPQDAGEQPTSLETPPEPIVSAVPSRALALAALTAEFILHQLESLGPVPSPAPAPLPRPPPTPTPTPPTPTPALAAETPPPTDPLSDGPPESGPVESAASIVPPRAIDNQKPKYPRVARQRGYEGTVELAVYVLANGKVGDVELVESSGSSSLDRAAIRAVERWRFAPATRNGRAVDIWIEVPIEFHLVER